MDFGHDTECALATVVEVVNTAPGPGSDEGLPDVAALQALVERQAVSDTGQLGADDLAAVRRLRDRLRAVFVAEDEKTAVRLVNDLIELASIREVIDTLAAHALRWLARRRKRRGKTSRRSSPVWERCTVPTKSSGRRWWKRWSVARPRRARPARSHVGGELCPHPAPGAVGICQPLQGDDRECKGASGGKYGPAELAGSTTHSFS